jgi:NTP pyrophosphatase (non-canonical NTP hydrolase)
MGQIASLQKKAWANKVAKGFNTSNIDREFNYTYAELAEAYDAVRKGKNSVGEELADTVIFILGLAEMLDVNLEDELINKLTVNEKRIYKAHKGHHIKEEIK